MSSRQNFFTTQLSFLIALGMSIFPLPDSIVVYNPQWLVLVTAYWGIFSPQRVGIISVWFWGLLLDVALGSHLGIHALSLALVSYVTIMLHQRLRMYPLQQQAFFIWLLASLDKLVAFQIMNFFLPREAQWSYWLSSLITAIFWPILLAMMTYYRRLTHNQPH